METDLAATIQANVGRAEALTRGLSHAQFNWRPEPGQWSMAQALTHLNIVNGQDLKPIQSAIEKGRRQGLTGRGPFTYGFFSRKFIASMEPPVKRKFKAPEYYQPPADSDLAQTLGEYRRIASELRTLTRAAAGLHLGRVRTTLPALPAFLRPILKMPLGARFELILAHDRRHLWQADQLRNHPAFPR